MGEERWTSAVVFSVFKPVFVEALAFPPSHGMRGEVVGKCLIISEKTLRLA
jgi:hypothetical protein